jgi:hypothetical protein
MKFYFTVRNLHAIHDHTEIRDCVINRDTEATQKMQVDTNQMIDVRLPWFVPEFNFISRLGAAFVDIIHFRGMHKAKFEARITKDRLNRFDDMPSPSYHIQRCHENSPAATCPSGRWLQQNSKRFSEVKLPSLTCISVSAT